MIRREHNRIVFEGGFYLRDLPVPLKLLHDAGKAGYEDVVLDFSGCTAAFAPPVLALCAQVMKLRTKQLDFELELPVNAKLARQFRNTNWAHYLAPDLNPPSEFQGFTHVPATQFTDFSGQTQAVNRIVNATLGAIPGLDRRELYALEWSINEIADNVLVHSQSPIGGLIQVTVFQRSTKRIEYVVVDAGVGIPRTLRQSHPEISSDEEALARISHG